MTDTRPDDPSADETRSTDPEATEPAGGRRATDGGSIAAADDGATAADDSRDDGATAADDSRDDGATAADDPRDDGPALTAEGVDHAYGDLRVLDDVTLAVPGGSVTALVGPNGSGKTTLLRAIAGLLDPTGGRIRHRDRDAVRPIGYLPQQPAFRPGFTAEETLSFYASLVGADEGAAARHLARVGLEEAADRPVEALSGGMTRLLGIAQATIGDPPVVVLDEPGSGLDPGMRTHVFDVVGDLADAGTAVLLSSHDLSLVERSADRVAMLDRRRIAAEGSPADLREEFDAESLLEAYEAVVAGEGASVRVGGESA